MKKRDIKVIKRDDDNTISPPRTTEQVLLKEQEDKAEDDRGLALAVKGWISDRRENSEAERLEAKDNRIAWDEDTTKKPV
jgi:hypothetical protein